MDTSSKNNNDIGVGGVDKVGVGGVGDKVGVDGVGDKVGVDGVGDVDKVGVGGLGDSEAEEEANRKAFEELPFSESFDKENSDNLDKDNTDKDNFDADGYMTDNTNANGSDSGLDTVSSKTEIIHTDAFTEHVNPLLNTRVADMSNDLVTETLTHIHNIRSDDQLMAEFNNDEIDEIIFFHQELYRTELTFSETNSSISIESQSVTDNSSISDQSQNIFSSDWSFFADCFNCIKDCLF